MKSVTNFNIIVMKNLILQITASQFIEKSRRHPPGIYLGLKLISFALIIAILNLTGGCMNYFIVTQVKSPVEENIDNFNSLGKKIIIHL